MYKINSSIRLAYALEMLALWCRTHQTTLNNCKASTFIYRNQVPKVTNNFDLENAYEITLLQFSGGHKNSIVALCLAYVCACVTTLDIYLILMCIRRYMYLIQNHIDSFSFVGAKSVHTLTCQFFFICFIVSILRLIETSAVQ